MNRSLVMGLVLVAAVGVAACGTPEEQKTKYRTSAEAYLHEGNFPKARVALRNVLKIDPKDAEAYFLYAQVEEKERNWMKAASGYQEVLRLDPKHERASIKLAKYYLEMRGLQQAAEIADRVLIAHPGYAPARAIKVAITALSGDVNNALQQAEQLIADAPSDPDAVLVMASVYSATQRTAEAVPHLRRALDANLNNLELLEAFSTILMKQGQTADAEATLAQIVKVEPTIFTHRLRQVWFYDHQQQYAKAEAVLQESIRANPDDEKRRLALVEYVAKRRGVEPAEAVLRHAQQEMPRSGKLRFALGNLYESTQRRENARDVYQDILKEFSGKPEALDAQVKLATMDWSSGKIEEAEQQLQTVLKENPRSTEGLILHGKIALQRGNGADAITDFRSVLKDQPERVEGYVLLARAHLIGGQADLARESLDRVIKMKPTLADAQLMVVGLDVAAGKIKEAKQRLESLLAAEPNNMAFLGAQFQLQLKEKDWNSSQATLKHLRQAGADSVAASLAEGHVALAQQKWDAAEAAYRKAAEQRPLAPEPLLSLVQLDMRQGRMTQAQHRLEALLQKTPDHPYAAGFLGDLLLTKGESATAVAYFEAATRVNPKWTTPWAHLARVQYAQRQMAEGDAALLKGLEANPENEQLRLMLALSLTAQHRYDEAILHYETVLRHAPRSIMAANNLAAVLLDHRGDTKSLDRALTLSKQFESQKPNPYLLDTLGWAHHKLGHSVEAVRVLKQVTSFAPDHPIFNYHLGAAYAKSGQRAEAVVHLKKAVEFRGAFEGIDEAKTLLTEILG
jgi:tetratricopeptide (TPR) repeat protein